MVHCAVGVTCCRCILYPEVAPGARGRSAARSPRRRRRMGARSRPSGGPRGCPCCRGRSSACGSSCCRPGRRPGRSWGRCPRRGPCGRRRDHLGMGWRVSVGWCEGWSVSISGGGSIRTSECWGVSVGAGGSMRAGAGGRIGGGVGSRLLYWSVGACIRRCVGGRVRS